MALVKPSIFLFIVPVVMTLSGCLDGGHGNSGSASTQTLSQTLASTPPATPTETSQQFVARVSAGTGTTTLATTPPTTSLMGCLTKTKTSNPRSLGGTAFLTNASGVEYRLIHFAYVMDASGLLAGESAQSDNGVTILPQNEYVALNSGQEILMAHRDDASTADRGVSGVNFPSGGVSLPSGSKLSVGSVSSIFPLTGGQAEIVDDSRLAGGTFMRMCYQADFVRADVVTAPSVASYRSPYRDRSYVADPARVHAPFTDFKNTTNNVINVYGVGVFYSTSTVTEPSNQEEDIYVNGNLVDTIALPPRQVGVSTALTPMIFPVNLTLKPGDVVAMRAKVTPTMAIVFDTASYLFTDEGLQPVNEQLDIADVDLNGDGYPDIVDIDANGSIWVSLRVGAGLQDTQQEWVRSLRGVTSLQLVPAASATAPVTLKASNPSGLCLNLTAVPSQALFEPDYCQTNGSPSVATDVWGDFNGDGWIDRMRIDTSALTYSVALGGPNGLGPSSPWVYGYGGVDRMFVSDANADGRDDIEAEWYESTNFHCVIWLSTGTSFTKTPCQP